MYKGNRLRLNKRTLNFLMYDVKEWCLTEGKFGGIINERSIFFYDGITFKSNGTNY